MCACVCVRAYRVLSPQTDFGLLPSFPVHLLITRSEQVRSVSIACDAIVNGAIPHSRGLSHFYNSPAGAEGGGALKVNICSIMIFLVIRVLCGASSSIRVAHTALLRSTSDT